jgi:hypothetical protein
MFSFGFMDDLLPGQQPIKKDTTPGFGSGFIRNLRNNHPYAGIIRIRFGGSRASIPSSQPKGYGLPVLCKLSIQKKYNLAVKRGQAYTQLGIG